MTDFNDAMMRLERRGSPVYCGPGWHQLLAALDADLAALDPGYTVDNIKEKFGTLRFSATPHYPAVYDQFEARIEEAEKLSARTCETCGAPGEVRDEFYWLKTMCTPHAQQRAEVDAQAARANRSKTPLPWPSLQARWGTGWTTLLFRLRHDLRRIDPELYVMAVRERRGVLHVAAWASNDDVRQAISERIAVATAESAVTCERCGDAGELQDGPQLTLCAVCDGLRVRLDGQRLRASSHPRWIEPLPGEVVQQVPVLLELDGQLVEVSSPSKVSAAMVERDGQLVWAVADGVEDAVGGAVPALVIRPLPAAESPM